MHSWTTASSLKILPAPFSILNDALWDKQIRAARADFARIEQRYGAAAALYAQLHPSLRGFQTAHPKLAKSLHNAGQRLATLLNRRRSIPPRIEIRDLSPGAVVKLAIERKHLTDLIKMIAYQAESDLLALLRPYYPRADDEGRTLLHDLLASPGDIRVSDSELSITLAPLSSPHRTRAAQALCELLNQNQTSFPGSALRIRFAVHPSPIIGLAFPGSPPSSRS